MAKENTRNSFRIRPEVTHDIKFGVVLENNVTYDVRALTEANYNRT